MSDDWKPVITAASWFSRADLERAIDEQVGICVADLREQLADDPDLSAGECALLLARAEPLIRQQTRDNLEKIWRQLCLEADASATIH